MSAKCQHLSAALHLDGPPGILAQAVLKRELACFTCPSVVEDYWDVLTRPKFARLGFPPAWFEPLLKEARHLDSDPPPWPLPGPDPDDLVFLALAQDTGAVLVTGNLVVLPKNIRKNVQVMGPRQYLDSLP
jgi:predicted nucleic acid-binding protein